MPVVVADAPYSELVPDWICEVISPNSEKYDQTDKVEIYAREHVGWAWLVNPLTRKVEVLERADRGWLFRHLWCDAARARALRPNPMATPGAVR
ncbi:MAG: Uma2 family endonuclease [Polyangiaceae bacterium]|nr:Uma2 family endonuclease [Polyangiaceae bacterium]